MPAPRHRRRGHHVRRRAGRFTTIHAIRPARRPDPNQSGRKMPAPTDATSLAPGESPDGPGPQAGARTWPGTTHPPDGVAVHAAGQRVLPHPGDGGPAIVGL